MNVALQSARRADPWTAEPVDASQRPIDPRDLSIELTDARRSLLYFFTKRCIDVSLAIMMVVLLAPVLLITALAIRLDSAGPVLFTQTRMGTRRRRSGGARERWDVRPFKIYKFRSMYANSDQRVHVEHIRRYTQDELDGAGTDTGFKVAADSRITRVGAVIRRLSIDELPQLWNVIKGDMSLVGPRPVPTYEVEGYRPVHCVRLAARPGLTGLWQVVGRGQVGLDDMVALDVALIERRSVAFEVGILLRTLPAVVRGAGAS